MLELGTETLGTLRLLMGSFPSGADGRQLEMFITFVHALLAHQAQTHVESHAFGRVGTQVSDNW